MIEKKNYRPRRGSFNRRSYDTRRRKTRGNSGRGGYTSPFNNSRNNEFDMRTFQTNTPNNFQNSPPGNFQSSGNFQSAPTNFQNGSQSNFQSGPPPNFQTPPPGSAMVPTNIGPMQGLPGNLEVNPFQTQNLLSNPMLTQAFFNLVSHGFSQNQPPHMFHNPGNNIPYQQQLPQQSNHPVKRKNEDITDHPVKKKKISIEQIEELRNEFEEKKKQHEADLHYLENLSKKLGKVESDIGQVDILKHSMATKIRLFEEKLRVTTTENEEIIQKIHSLHDKKKKLIEERERTERKLKSLEPSLEEASGNLMRLELRFNIEKKRKESNDF